MSSQHNDVENPGNPLTDDQTKSQVIDLARQIANLNNLPGLSAGFYFQSCNDQGEKPFQGSSHDGRATVDANAYLHQIAQTR